MVSLARRMPAPDGPTPARRRPPARPQRDASDVIAQPVEVVHDVAASQPHLRPRHDELVIADAAAALFDRGDLGIPDSTPRLRPLTSPPFKAPFAVGAFGSSTPRLLLQRRALVMEPPHGWPHWSRIEV